MKRRYLIVWLERHHGNMSAMAREQGTTKQNTHQMVKRAGLLDLARELVKQWKKDCAPERIERARVRSNELGKARYKRQWRKRWWRAKKRQEARQRKLDERKIEVAECIKRTGGSLMKIRHELGIGRHTVIRWLHELDLWGLVDEVKAEARKRRG